MSTANKILMGAAGAAGGGGPSDDEFNRVSFLSHFEGSNNGVNNAFDDGSASNHTITANGNVTQGSFGPFARPDGEWGVTMPTGPIIVNNYAGSVEVASHSDFTLSGQYTIEFFVNSTTLKNPGGVSNIGLFAVGPENNANSMNLFFAGTTVRYWTSSAYNTFGSSSDIVTNTWVHIAVCRNSSNVITCFVNGTALGTTFSDTTTPQGQVVIGAELYNTTRYNSLVGSISNFRILNGTCLYTSNFTAPTSALTAVTNTKLLTCQSNRFVDNSASGHTVTVTGAPAVSAFGPFLTSSVYKAGTNGASLNTPGAGGDYLSFGNIGLDGHSGDFSVEGWIYPTSYSQYSNTIYGQGGSGDTSNMLELSLNASGQTHAFINEGGVTLQSTFVCPLNAWTFVQLKRTSGTLAIFINGAQSSTVSNTATLGSPNRAFVGAQSYDPSISSRSFRGFICDVRCSVVTRSVSLPTAPLAVTDSNTKLLLNMKDGQAIDQVAKSNIALEGNAVTSTAQKKFGTASFYSPGGDGDKGLINTSGGALLPAYNWTIEAWTYCTNSAANQVVFAQGLSGGGGRVALGIEGSVYLLQIGSAKPQHNARTLNQWVHLCATYDGTTAKLYIDGTLASSGSVSYTTATDQNLQAGIGALGTGWSTSAYGKWYGYIDELRVSRFIRYTSNFTAPSEPFADKGQ